MKGIAGYHRPKPAGPEMGYFASCQQHFPLLGKSSNLEGVYRIIFSEVNSHLQGPHDLSGRWESPVSELEKVPIADNPAWSSPTSGLWACYSHLEEGQCLHEISTGTLSALLFFPWLTEETRKHIWLKVFWTRRCEGKVTALTLPEMLWLGFIFNIPAQYV